MFCNGYGDILRKPFSVKNSPDGVRYLVDQATRSCRRRGIKKNHVFFVGEDANSYAENFVNTLRSKGWFVAGVNAHEWCQSLNCELKQSCEWYQTMNCELKQFLI